jgi:hypothetical protein
MISMEKLKMPQGSTFQIVPCPHPHRYRVFKTPRY